MSHKSALGHLIFFALSLVALSGCFHPPYNNFKPYRRAYSTTGPGAVVGTAAVAAAGGPVLAGTAIGAAVGAAVGLHKDSKPALIKELKGRFQIDYIEYGDTVTFIVPVDRYFVFNSARLNELCYAGLADLIKLIKTFPRCCPIYVAGFTDNVGSRYHKRMMSQARAETMLTFLWANGIPAKRLNAEGYSDKHPVGDNKLIHGSAYNRRLEIQLFMNCATPQAGPIPYLGPTK
ncbi:C-OmpA-like family protein CmpA [Legionella fairfieldensis]|uniref:C-OmpA-like family protein CmpA n=1 Tax=Legionella fairfieldensis TaxID=45064 RepID=UPI000564BC09|nr:C-OmpA-like family protein CmpA [Legionella fairfieldensis]